MAMIPKPERKSVLAGALIAIGALFSIAARPCGNVVQGLCFSVGLFGVLACDARLFTGSVLTIRAVWEGRTPLSRVLRSWVGIWAGNLLGAICVALMAAGTLFDASYVAQYKAAMPWHELLVRAVLCNVMVCMAVWIANESPFSAYGTVDALAACLLPVACFVTCGFEHSVADMLYMPLGMLQGSVGVLDGVRVVLLATAGNVIGGVAFAWMIWEREG